MPTSQDPTHAEGIEIKIARIRAGLRQYEVAMSVGIPPARLSEIEAGRRRSSPELLERILQVMKGGHDNQTKKETKAGHSRTVMVDIQPGAIGEWQKSSNK